MKVRLKARLKGLERVLQARVPGLEGILRTRVPGLEGVFCTRVLGLEGVFRTRVASLASLLQALEGGVLRGERVAILGAEGGLARLQAPLKAVELALRPLGLERRPLVCSWSTQTGQNG